MPLIGCPRCTLSPFKGRDALLWLLMPLDTNSSDRLVEAEEPHHLRPGAAVPTFAEAQGHSVIPLRMIARRVDLAA